MKVSPEEYNKLMSQYTDPNLFQQELLIPLDEPMYKIDLNKRTIEAPTLLGVTGEHDAEVFWFYTDRFFDSFDLSTAVVWIQYRNAQNEELIYMANPIVVTDNDYRVENIIGAGQNGSELVLIPWPIGYDVTKKAGTVEFSFQFFRLSKDRKSFAYIINTQSAKSKVVAGLDIDIPEGDYDTSFAAGLLEKLSQLYEDIQDEYELYWIEE